MAHFIFYTGWMFDSGVFCYYSLRFSVGTRCSTFLRSFKIFHVSVLRAINSFWNSLGCLSLFVRRFWFSACSHLMYTLHFSLGKLCKLKCSALFFLSLKKRLFDRMKTNIHKKIYENKWPSFFFLKIVFCTFFGWYFFNGPFWVDFISRTFYRQTIVIRHIDNSRNCA